VAEGEAQIVGLFLFLFFYFFYASDFVDFIYQKALVTVTKEAFYFFEQKKIAFMKTYL
jgi:hypothetical protein